MAQAYGFTQVDFIAARYKPEELVLAGPGRRLAGYCIDWIGFGLPWVLMWFALWAWLLGVVFLSPTTAGVGGVLFLLAMLLGLGWLIWFFFAATNGQTPGKQLLGMYIIKSDGTRAGGGYTWVREFLVKWVLTQILSAITGGLFWIVAALWCLWDSSNQCLWDKMASTYVGYSPYGYKPLTMAELISRGLRPPTPRGFATPGAEAMPNIVINNNAQVGSNLNSPGMLGGSANAYALNQPVLAAGAGRVALFDGGRSAGMQVLQPGQRIVAGRDHSSQLLVTDPAASRRHLEIMFDGAGWLVRDLGAMNPARVISGDAQGVVVSQTGLRMRAGQLTIGNAVLTLFPPGGGQA